MAEACLEHPRIAAFALAVARSQHIEKLLDLTLIAYSRNRLPAGVETALLGKCYQLFNDWAQILGLGQRRDDLLMLDQRRRHVGEHGLAMRCRAVETAACKSVTHGTCLLELRLSIMLRLVFFGELFYVFRRPVRHFHAEMKPHLRQHFLDLVQGFAAE